MGSNKPTLSIATAIVAVLVLSGCQPKGVATPVRAASAPSEPAHKWIIRDGEEYGYGEAISADAARAGRVAPQVHMYRYLGRNAAGEYLVSSEENGVHMVAACVNPCVVIKIVASESGQSESERDLFKPKSLIGEVLTDAIRDQLVVYGSGGKVANAASERPAGSPASLGYVATMNGRCSHLVFAGRDGSTACTPKVINDVHKDGRVGFTFLVSDLAVITFSGMGQQQVKDAADVATQPLDTVIFTLTGTGTAPKTIEAAGVCTYSNPYAGPAKVVCSAHTGEGLFEATFLSDGREPSMHHF